MVCVKCGHELRENQLYCPLCGHVIQIVPDYNPIEDELSDHIFKNADSEHKNSINSDKEEVGASFLNRLKTTFNTSPRNPKWQYLSRIQFLAVILSILFCIIIIVVIAISSIEKSRSNSFDYQLKKAYENETTGDFEAALDYAQRALVLKPADYDAELLIANIYYASSDIENAKLILQELISFYPDYQEPYELLIYIYESEKDYKQLAQIGKEIKNSKINRLFEKYLASEPVFSIKEGTYGHPIKLILTSDTKDPIYYTIDGTEPTKTSLLYQNPILLNEDITTVSAVTQNNLGVYSAPVRKTYTIKYPVPGIPIITPDSGEYHEPMKIEVLVPESCEAYYTFDGSIPTKESSGYVGALDMPEGNQIFSVIIYNEYDIPSPIEQRNYKYDPET